MKPQNGDFSPYSVSCWSILIGLNILFEEYVYIYNPQSWDTIKSQNIQTPDEIVEITLNLKNGVIPYIYVSKDADGMANNADSDKMSLILRKPVFLPLQTTKAQISLRIRLHLFFAP